MVTLKAMVLKYNVKDKDGKVKTNIKKDGTYNCVIRITHKRQSKYIATPIYVVPNQLTKSDDIKDPNIKDALNTLVKKYRERIVLIADRIEYFNIDDLIAFVSRSVDDIDFVKYGLDFTANLSAGTKSNYRTVINSLIDFGGSSISISKINSSFLRKFEAYLFAPRKISRIDRWGNSIQSLEAPVSPRSLFNYMNALKTIFKAARDEYNNEETGDIRIPFYPFKAYQIPIPPKSKKRNLDLDPMLEIINGEGFGRDVYMISFLLCGMNTKDIFNATVIKNGRIEYNRSKTRGKRSDEAFISIKIEPELIPLLNKYRDTSGKRVFLFHTIYKESRNFTQYANNSLKKILPGKTTYYARHTWANTARNKCGVSKDIVSESLNHTTGNNVTDTYLERNWSAIDEANRKVIDYYFSISNVSPL